MYNFIYCLFFSLNSLPPRKLEGNRMRKDDETELRAFFVANTALYHFILCLFFLKAEKKRERESKGDKKIHGVPFHQKGL